MTYPGQRIQVDVKVVPRKCIADSQLRLYQYTAIDELLILHKFAGEHFFRHLDSLAGDGHLLIRLLFKTFFFEAARNSPNLRIAPNKPSRPPV